MKAGSLYTRHSSPAVATPAAAENDISNGKEHYIYFYSKKEEKTH